MKKKKIKLQKLSLEKQTIASVNSNEIQGGLATTHLETRFVTICKTGPITAPPVGGSLVICSKQTYCLSECLVCK